MILVDTSIWVDHLRHGDDSLKATLLAVHVLGHPFVVGELACGSLKARAEVLALLAALPRTPIAQPDEVLHFIERRTLMGRGIGYVDAHLLAATALTPGARLWTRDRRLATLAGELSLAHPEPAP